MKTIHFKSRKYPALQAEGNAAQWAMPFAKEFLKDCKVVFDVGCKKQEWAYPGATLIDPALNDYSATKFPDGPVPDGIFSSHCLEHVPDWVGVLNYWHSKLMPGGVVFLYLPHPDQEYWLPWNNRKHVNLLSPDMLAKYFFDKADCWRPFFVTEGHDLNHSFYAVAEKA